MRIFHSGILWVFFTTAAQAGPDACLQFSDDAIRLACYDVAMGYKADGLGDGPASPATPTTNGDEPPAPTKAPDTGKWQMRRDISQLTDEKYVFVTTKSNETIPGRFGSAGNARLSLRCMENTTAVILTMNDHFMADIQGYGRVEYRLDDRAMQRVSMTESTDNSALGLWRGGSAIPFIKSLFGHQRLVVRATPFNESALTVTFDISGVEAATAELRETCHW